MVDKHQEGLVFFDQQAVLYRSLRHLNGIAEGADEIEPESAIPLEVNMDRMNGIDFQKGCYLGQELVARTYHQGLVRKRLLSLVRASVPKEKALSDPGHPIHGLSLAASHDAIVPPGFAVAVAEGLIDPDLDFGLSVGSVITPLGDQSGTSSRFQSSIVSSDAVWSSGLAMLRMEQLLGSDVTLSDVTVSPPVVNSVFAGGNLVLKAIAPVWWYPYASSDVAARSPFSKVEWDLLANFSFTNLRRTPS